MLFCFSLSVSRSPFFVLWVLSCRPSRVQLCPSLLHSFLVRYCFTAFVCLFNLLLFAKNNTRPSLCGFSCRHIPHKRALESHSHHVPSSPLSQSHCLPWHFTAPVSVCAPITCSSETVSIPSVGEAGKGRGLSIGGGA